MSAALELAHVTVRRSGRDVLADLSLALPSGSLTLVLGPNGAGKSTLLRTATGELKPSEGRLLTLGNDIANLDWRSAAQLRRRIGIMPQLPEHAPAAPLSVREVVEMARAAHHPASPRLLPEERDLCEHWIRRFSLEAYADRPYFALSGGEQRKTHLARIFAQQAELILLDEPAGHLDLPSQDNLVRLVGEVWKETRSTIVIVTHDLRQLPPEATHVMLLSRGELLALGNPSETLTDQHLSRLFGEPISVVQHAGHYIAVATGEKGAVP